MNIGDKIKALRFSNNLTQEQFAHKCNLSKNAIWSYENGKRKPSIEALSKIASSLNMELYYIIEDHAVNGERIKHLLSTNKLSVEDLSKDLNIPSEIILNFMEGKEIITNKDQKALYKISDYFKISHSYLLGETDFKYYEDTIISELNLLINQINSDKNNNIKVLSRDLFEVIILTISRTILISDEKELSLIKDFYNVIYKLKQGLSQQILLPKNNNENTPLNIEYISKLSYESKENFYKLVDQFVNYYLYSNDLSKDFIFDKNKLLNID